MLELESLHTILNGKVLEEFLRRYLRHFPLDKKLSDKELEVLFRVAFDERALRLSHDLLKKFLDCGISPISLNDAAELLWEKGQDDSSRDRFKYNMRKHLRPMLTDMRKLRLWSVQRTGAVGAYHIWAGPALRQFEKLLYREMRVEQLQDFCRKFGKGL